MAHYCSNRDPEPTYSPGLGSPLSYQTPTGQVLPSRLHTSFDSDLLSQFAPEHPGLSPKPGEILSSRHTGWLVILPSPLHYKPCPSLPKVGEASQGSLPLARALLVSPPLPNKATKTTCYRSSLILSNIPAWLQSVAITSTLCPAKSSPCKVPRDPQVAKSLSTACPCLAYCTFLPHTTLDPFSTSTEVSATPFSLSPGCPSNSGSFLWSLSWTQALSVGRLQNPGTSPPLF